MAGLRNDLFLQYEAGSAPALALTATMERTQARFASYAKAGLLCGVDGLPHLIADPGLAIKYGHAGETFVSTQRPVMLLSQSTTAA
jgi:photosystem I subunit III